MDVNCRSILKRSRRWILSIQTQRFFEENIECRAAPAKIDRSNNVAPFDLLGAGANGDIWKIDCRAHSRLRRFQLAAVTLNRSDARFKILWLNNNVLAAPKFAASQRTGHNCADPSQREGAIDKQSRLADVTLRLHAR